MAATSSSSSGASSRSAAALTALAVVLVLVPGPRRRPREASSSGRQDLPDGVHPNKRSPPASTGLVRRRGTSTWHPLHPAIIHLVTLSLPLEVPGSLLKRGRVLAAPVEGVSAGVQVDPGVRHRQVALQKEKEKL